MSVDISTTNRQDRDNRQHSSCAQLTSTSMHEPDRVVNTQARDVLGPILQLGYKLGLAKWFLLPFAFVFCLVLATHSMSLVWTLVWCTWNGNVQEGKCFLSRRSSPFWVKGCPSFPKVLQVWMFCFGMLRTGRVLNTPHGILLWWNVEF